MGKKMRMDRGIDSLFADNEIQNEQDAGSIQMVRLSLIEPNRSQPRENFDEEKLNELAESIRQNGIIQPITVRELENGGYQIIAGERRWRAARIAQITEIPVYIKNVDDKTTMQLALIENIQRENLSPLEESAAYQSLMETYGMTQQEVANAVGKSRSVIANSVRLLTLCEQVKELINSRELTTGHAKVLAGMDESAQIEFANAAVTQGLTVRQLENMVSQKNHQEKLHKEENTSAVNSIKEERPFLKEFEMAVNSGSNIKVKAKGEKDGSAVLTMKIGREIDSEEFLKKLAFMLCDY